MSRITDARPRAVDAAALGDLRTPRERERLTRVLAARGIALTLPDDPRSLVQLLRARLATRRMGR